MWYTPSRTDFEADSVVFSSVGKLRRSLFRNFQSLALVLIGQVRASKFKEEILVSQLSSVLKHLLHRLEFISTGFFTMCFGVCEMQRIYLELTGLLNYMEHYRLRSTSLGTIDNIMGGFTHDPLVCERFYKAGIPVWLIRPYSALASICIRALACKSFFLFFLFFFLSHQFIMRGSLAVRGQHIQTLSTLRLRYAVPVMYYQNLGTSFWQANAGRSPRISSLLDLSLPPVTMGKYARRLA
jgi:hypothetical protein